MDLWRENSSLHVFVSRYFVIESSISSARRLVQNDGIFSKVGLMSLRLLFSASLKTVSTWSTFERKKTHTFKKNFTAVTKKTFADDLTLIEEKKNKDLP